MTRERWQALMENDDLRLTVDELAAGFHFCAEWDGLLIGPPDMGEWESCVCGFKDLHCDKCKKYHVKGDQCHTG